MAGYNRQDTSNNISNGNVIDADDLDNEFNQVENAFSSSTGHTHDGTTAEGAPILVIGPTQDVVATASVLRPKTTNVVDLGTDALRFKDGYMSGTLNVATSIVAAGTLSVEGNTVLGNAASDTVTFTADVSSNIIPSVDNTYDLGATGSEWKDAYITGTGYIDTLDATNATLGTTVVSTSISGGIFNPTTLQIGGVAVTADAAELNALDGITATATELNYTDITTLGTSEASKVLTADANGDVLASQEFRAVSYNETLGTVTAGALDLETGNVFVDAPASDVTYSFTNAPASGTAYGFTLKITPSATVIITWPSTVDWPDGTQPVGTSRDETDVFVFFTHDNGATFYGFRAGNALA